MITKCRSCVSNKLQGILTLGNQYLSDFVAGDEKPPRHPLDLVLCENCTLLQLKETTPAGEMYNDHYGYRSGINNTIREDLKSIVDSTKKLIHLQEQDAVVDIGSNDGQLLRYYPWYVQKVGFDPVSKFAEYYKNDKTMIFVNDYFSANNYPLTRKPRIITAISCFYDLDDPNSFVKDLQELLAPDGILIIQQNYLVTMLENNAYDNVCHEHLEYYSLTSLEHLLNSHGLEVFNVEENTINGGSFRTFIRHMNSVDKMRVREKKLKLENKFTYHLWGMNIEKQMKELNTFIAEEVGKGRKVYLYGASTRGNTLLQACGLDKTLITAAVERNPEKWGKKIASVGIPIISEEQARKEKPDYMLVGPWFFKNEFLKREEEYLKQGGKFIFPLPEFLVVGYENNSSDSNDTKRLVGTK